MAGWWGATVRAERPAYEGPATVTKVAANPRMACITPPGGPQTCGFVATDGRRVREGEQLAHVTVVRAEDPTSVDAAAVLFVRP